MQLELPGLPPATPTPPGFVYVEAIVSAAEEGALLRALAEVPLGAYVMHGVAARRRVAHFGWSYGADRRIVEPAGPLPAFLLPLRDRCAAVAGKPAERLEEVLVTRYPPGAGIGWHRDAPQFGTVVGVSLAAPCRFRLRRGEAGARERLELVLPPRSAYVLAGAARWQWQHGIPPVPQERWSVTFRTVIRRGGR